MNNQEDEDFEQVYTVSENEEFHGDGGGSFLQSKNSMPVVVAFGLVIFLPLAFVALIVSTIVKTTTGIYYSDLAMPLSLGCIAVSYIAITKYISSMPKPSEDDNLYNNVTSNGKGKKKKKKFKNIAEHRAYLESIGHDVDNDPRFRSSAGTPPPLPTDTNSADSTKKVADEIELAVDALVKLGFGVKKAKDWVMRGISEGIQTSDAQGLIMYALSRGASLQNRKNK